MRSRELELEEECTRLLSAALARLTSKGAQVQGRANWRVPGRPAARRNATTMMRQKRTERKMQGEADWPDRVILGDVGK